MSKSFNYWLCVVALTVFGFIGVFNWPMSTPATAQQPPPPNPPPGPADTCCELLTPGGNTIGGPGVSPPGDPVSDIDSNIIFLALGPQDACITLTNTGPFPLRFNMTDRSDRVLGQDVDPGRTKILCVSKTNLARVNCDGPAGRGCSYRWRVDKPL
jgi:hypothetical protein